MSYLTVEQARAMLDAMRNRHVRDQASTHERVGFALATLPPAEAPRDIPGETTAWFAESRRDEGVWHMHAFPGHTRDPHRATSWNQRVNCQEWCDAHNHSSTPGGPEWYPTEHLFVDPAADAFHASQTCTHGVHVRSDCPQCEEEWERSHGLDGEAVRHEFVCAGTGQYTAACRELDHTCTCGQPYSAACHQTSKTDCGGVEGHAGTESAAPTADIVLSNSRSRYQARPAVVLPAQPAGWIQRVDESVYGKSSAVQPPAPELPPLPVEPEDSCPWEIHQLNGNRIAWRDYARALRTAAAAREEALDTRARQAEYGEQDAEETATRAVERADAAEAERDALRARIAASEEPVAWRYYNKHTRSVVVGEQPPDRVSYLNEYDVTPLYAAPPATVPLREHEAALASARSQERARIVAWLRERASPPWKAGIAAAADLIEAEGGE